MRWVAFATALALLLFGSPAQAAYTAVATVNWGTDTNVSCSGPCSNSSVQGAIQSALGITGVTISGAIADSTYTADGNVVGTVNKSGSTVTVTPYTLANYDTPSGQSSLDTFLQNNSPTSNAITITLKLPANITALSFDYEIFPDDTCTNVTTGCGTNDANLPDLTVTDNSATIFQRYAVVPGQSLGTVEASCTGVTGQTDCGGVSEGSVDASTVGTTDKSTYSGAVNSTASGDVTDHSVTSGATVTSGVVGGTAELAPQLLGSSGIVALPAGTGSTTLTFNDWPATIAINNIVFYDGSTPAPEPGSLALLASGLLAMAILRRRKASREKSAADFSGII